MDALFFLSSRDDAIGVSASDDLPSEPVADALRLEDPSALRELALILGVERPPKPLRDATCRSFPVWELGPALGNRLSALSDAAIDDTAEQWQKSAETSLDADLYELAGCLGDLRQALREAAPSDALYVLLEERAW
jgi:hypothetical protein